MLLSFVFYSLLFFYYDVESSRISNISERIIGGESADIKDFPYQLSMEYFDLNGEDHFCGASIIHPSWALTAAHCFNAIINSLNIPVQLRSGSSYRHQGGALHDAEKIIIHPYYDANLLDYDVALIKVSNPFQYSDVAQNIMIASETPPPGSPAVVTGFGVINYNNQEPDRLQKLVLYTIDSTECKYIDAEFYDLVTPRKLCAQVAGAPGRNAYLGDSGGPLVVDNIQVGIVSWVNYRDFAYRPAIYTDVAQISTWVTSTIETESMFY